jgi:hypothetical protein
MTVHQPSFRGLVKCRNRQEIDWFRKHPMAARNLAFELDINESERQVRSGPGDVADPEQLAEFLHEFLETHRPGECLAITWTASIGDSNDEVVNGGAILVTADGWRSMTLASWVDEQRSRFAICGGDVWYEDREHSRDEWRDDVAAGDTLLGYWDWRREQVDDRISVADSSA